MRLLVTGGAGYVGTTLVPLLLQAGHAVTVLDTLDHGSTPILPFFRLPGFTFLQGSVLDRAVLTAAAGGCDALVHLAAVVGFPACAREPERARAINVEGSRRVAEAAGADRPVVYASTGSCYGALRGELCSEESPLRPVSVYGITKTEGETVLRDGCRAVTLRFATGYGLSPRMRTDLLVNDFVRRAQGGEPVAVYEPEALRSFLHVEDIARGLLFALAHRETMIEGVFNVGDESQNLSKRRLCELIQQRLPEARFSFEAPGEDPDQRDYTVSYEKIKALGYRTRTDITAGIDELARAFAWR